MFRIPASLPLRDLRIEKKGDEDWTFDPIRKKLILLTPEEWVRQNLILFLTEDIRVPKALISLEKGLQYNRLAKRYDLVVFDRNGNPALACECKAPMVELGELTIRQIFTYNTQLKAPRVLITNGKNLLLFEKKEDNIFTESHLLGEFWIPGNQESRD